MDEAKDALVKLRGPNCHLKMQLRAGPAEQLHLQTKTLSFFKELEFLVAPVARQPSLKNLLNKRSPTFNNQNAYDISGIKIALTVFSLSRSFLLPVTILSVIFCTHASVGMDVISYYGMTLLAFPGVG